jgi:hypothetical protein
MQVVQDVRELDEYTPAHWKAMTRHIARLVGDLNMHLTLGGQFPHEWVVGAAIESDDN